MRYQFINPERTIVQRLEDGATFEWPRHTHPSNLHGFVAEQWRSEGCPAPEPYKALESARVPDDQARALRRDAGDDTRRRG